MKKNVLNFKEFVSAKVEAIKEAVEAKKCENCDCECENCTCDNCTCEDCK